MKQSGIYQIKNLITNKVYIGSSKHLSLRKSQHFNRLRSKKHVNNKLQNSWNKHGSENFIFEIIELCSEEYLLVREQFYIDYFKSVTSGYNLAPVAGRSTLGFKHSEESKAKMSKAKSGVKLPRTPEHQAKLNDSQRGRSVSKETRDKIASKLRGGKSSEETKAKLRLHMQTRIPPPVSEAARINMSIAQKKRFEKARTEKLMNEYV